MNSNYLINFNDFLSQPELPIDINKSLRENILLALNFKEDNKKFNTNLITLYKNKQRKLNLNKKMYYSTRNKLIKRDRLNINNYINTKRGFHLNKTNYKSLLFDFDKQKKVFNKEEEKTGIKLREELKLEINKVEDDIKNKQARIKDIEKKLNLIPFSSGYYNKKKIEKKSRNKEIEKENFKRLRLISLQEVKNNLLINLKKIQKSNSSNNDIFKSNERLYYSWFRDKTKRDINKFLKTTKLTEFVLYNKTKEKLLKDKYKGEFLQRNSIG